ncbi:MAG: hypothetical protein H0X65_12240 [Gemmatimonadetes bacterium]|nr:hypothetical protein [Gemmatimonadota bacterium]
MVFGEVFSRFQEESPVAVMASALMERVLAPEKIDQIFTRTAKVQYERDLLVSSVVDLMSEVVGGVSRSVNAAYQGEAEAAEDHGPRSGPWLPRRCTRSGTRR